MSHITSPESTLQEMETADLSPGPKVHNVAVTGMLRSDDLVNGVVLKLSKPVLSEGVSPICCLSSMSLEALDYGGVSPLDVSMNLFTTPGGAKLDKIDNEVGWLRSSSGDPPSSHNVHLFTATPGEHGRFNSKSKLLFNATRKNYLDTYRDLVNPDVQSIIQIPDSKTTLVKSTSPVALVAMANKDALNLTIDDTTSANGSTWLHLPTETVEHVQQQLDERIVTPLSMTDLDNLELYVKATHPKLVEKNQVVPFHCQLHLQAVEAKSSPVSE